MMKAELWIVLIIALALVALTARQIRQATGKRIPKDPYGEIQERINLLESRRQNESEEEAQLDSLMIGELRRALSRSKRGQL